MYRVYQYYSYTDGLRMAQIPSRRCPTSIELLIILVSLLLIGHGIDSGHGYDSNEKRGNCNNINMDRLQLIVADVV